MSEKPITTHDLQKIKATVQEYQEPDTRLRLTSFELQRQGLTEQWIDPTQAEKDRIETRKRLELSELQEMLTRIQQRIAELEKELHVSNPTEPSHQSHSDSSIGERD